MPRLPRQSSPGFVFTRRRWYTRRVADDDPLPYPESLCHRCAAPPKYVRTARSTFVLCPIHPKKYPPQPMRSCPLFRPCTGLAPGGDPTKGNP
jgi:hypothetical protein